MVEDKGQDTRAGKGSRQTMFKKLLNLTKNIYSVPGRGIKF